MIIIYDGLDHEKNRVEEKKNYDDKRWVLFQKHSPVSDKSFNLRLHNK
jgi:hypothetical protein